MSFVSTLTSSLNVSQSDGIFVILRRQHYLLNVKALLKIWLTFWFELTLPKANIIKAWRVYSLGSRGCGSRTPAGKAFLHNFPFYSHFLFGKLYTSASTKSPNLAPALNSYCVVNTGMATFPLLFLSLPPPSVFFWGGGPSKIKLLNAGLV